MISRRVSDLFGDDDLPTTADDVRALREHRPRQPQPGVEWLEQLTVLASQAPTAATNLRQRRSFAGLPPFEL
jgi:hypothetical protein